MVPFFLSLLGLARTFPKSKCKELLRTTMKRIQILRSKTERVVEQISGDIAELHSRGEMQRAKAWVDQLWKELCKLFTYGIISDYCHKVRINLSTIAGQRECPMDLEEPIASLCFAASRCADFPELQDIRAIFHMKYGSHVIDYIPVNPMLLAFQSNDENLFMKSNMEKYLLEGRGEKDSWQKELLVKMVSEFKANETNQLKLLPAPRQACEEEYRHFRSRNKALIHNIDQQQLEIPTSLYVKLHNMSPSSDLDVDSSRYMVDSPVKRGTRLIRRAANNQSQAVQYDIADDCISCAGENNDLSFIPSPRYYGDGHHVHEDLGRPKSNTDTNGDKDDVEEPMEGYSNRNYTRRLYLMNHGRRLTTNYQFDADNVSVKSVDRCSRGPPRRPPPPLRAPPSIPRVSSMPNLAESDNSDTTNTSTHVVHPPSLPSSRAFFPPDYDMVVAKVAELSAN